MSRTNRNRKYIIGGKSHGLRKELYISGIGLDCSWRRDIMMGHRDDLKELKLIRKVQGKIRRTHLKNELQQELLNIYDNE